LNSFARARLNLADIESPTVRGLEIMIRTPTQAIAAGMHIPKSVNQRDCGTDLDLGPRIEIHEVVKGEAAQGET
jgi:hypothetical protein